jgi:hypothetical protein
VNERYDPTKVSDFFDLATCEKSDYNDQASRDFITSVLSSQDRQDRLVSVEIKRKKKRQPLLSARLTSLLASMDQEWEEYYELNLNCTLARAQMILELTPKFRALQHHKLALSFAPSLQHCYVFEVLTAHPRSDWDEFAVEGVERIRRWYKLDWDADPQFLVEKVCDGLDSTLENHIKNRTKIAKE